MPRVNKTQKGKAVKKPISNLPIPTTKFTLIIGIFLIVLGVFFHYQNSNPLSFSGSIPYASQTSIVPRPIEIAIPSLNLQHSVRQTRILDGEWEIFKDGVSHAAHSAYPTDSGNIIMYAHNTKKMFGNLKDIRKGDTIIVMTEDGKNHYYKVTSTQTVNPDQIHPLLQTEKEILTLYTCTGFADSKRFIVKATPQR